MLHNHLHECPACRLDTLTEDTCPKNADHFQQARECPGCAEEYATWENSLSDLDRERLIKSAERTVAHPLY